MVGLTYPSTFVRKIFIDCFFRRSFTQAESQLRRMVENNALGLTIDADSLTDYEMMIASHLVNPNDIAVSWNSIAGLEGVIQELKETVVLPIQRKDLFEDSQLTQAPKVRQLY